MWKDIMCFRVWFSGWQQACTIYLGKDGQRFLDRPGRLSGCKRAPSKAFLLVVVAAESADFSMHLEGSS